MTRLLRGNREIVVRDEDVAAYLNEGYAVIDNRGNVITEPKAMDYPAAMKKIEELEAYKVALSKSIEAANNRIKELEDDINLQADRIVELTTERDELFRQLNPSAEDPAEVSEPEPQQTEPAKSKKAKATASK